MIIHGPYEQSAESRAERLARLTHADRCERHKTRQQARYALALLGALAIILALLWAATS